MRGNIGGMALLQSDLVAEAAVGASCVAAGATVAASGQGRVDQAAARSDRGP
ncbi:MAG: hypothetical protein Q7T28_00405 [Cypionkella sp.]|nr:hypothetical protein [Cypionkella sp.]